MRTWIWTIWWSIVLATCYFGWWFHCQPFDWKMEWLERVQVTLVLLCVLTAIVVTSYYAGAVVNNWFEKKAAHFRRVNNTRKLNAMWMETDCPECGVTYQWHRECRNRCTSCGADYGHMVTHLGELKGYVENN